MKTFKPLPYTFPFRTVVDNKYSNPNYKFFIEDGIYLYAYWNGVVYISTGERYLTTFRKGIHTLAEAKKIIEKHYKKNLNENI
jgi:hypothetical protein